MRTQFGKKEHFIAFNLEHLTASIPLKSFSYNALLCDVKSAISFSNFFEKQRELFSVIRQEIHC